MPDKIPLRVTVDSNNDTDGVSEFQSGETLGTSHGGTGLSSLGTANQIIQVNAGGTALEFVDPNPGDITGITTAANSGLAGGANSGAPTLSVDANNLSSVTAASTDYVIVEDVTDNSTKKALVSDIVNGYATESYVTSQGFADIGLVIALG